MMRGETVVDAFEVAVAALDLEKLPFILAGPIVRRVTKDRVAVWIALRVSASVRVQVVDSTTPSSVRTSAPATTARIGKNLHLGLFDLDTSGSPLSEDVVYYYNLMFSDGMTGDLSSAGNLTPPNVMPAASILSYPSVPTAFAGLPSFVIPQSDLSKVRLCQGSCRKPHADSLDAMVILDADLADNANTSAARVQQLFLTGDQIYADDVADSFLVLIRDVATTIIGDDVLIEGADGRQITANQLEVGHRAKFVRDTMKFTSDPKSGDFDPGDVIAKSHVLSFSEFCAMYLLMWSDALWPTPLTLSAFDQIYPGVSQTKTVFYSEGEKSTFETPQSKRFTRENTALRSFFRSLPKVRRALANVATYMLLDDHEVADDFFINRLWMRNVSRSPEGLVVIRNGLLAYALFQAWGNVPTDPTDPGKRQFDPIVNSAVQWQATGFSASASVLADVSALIGVPSPNQQLTQASEYDRATSPTQLDWHFRLVYANYEILALDMRSHRLYQPIDLAPAALISGDALVAQVPLTAPTWANIDGGITIVIAPGPWTSLSFIEGRQRSESNATGVFDRDVELLHLDAAAYDGLITRLAARDNGRSRVVVFTGDVHYGFATGIQYWSRLKNPLDPTPVLTDTRAAFAQFVASALKNQDVPKFVGTLALHYAGFRGNNRDVTRLGWRAGPGAQSVRVGTATFQDNSNGSSTRTVAWDVPVGDNETAVTELDRETDRFQSVTPSTSLPIDWRMRRVLYKAGPRGATVQPVNTIIDLILAFITLFIEYLHGYTRIERGGKEVVGVNNIGFLTLQWGTGEDKQAIHQLRWFAESFDKLYEAQASDPGDGSSYLKFLTQSVQQIPLVLDDPPPAEEIEL